MRDYEGFSGGDGVDYRWRGVGVRMLYRDDELPGIVCAARLGGHRLGGGRVCGRPAVIGESSLNTGVTYYRCDEHASDVVITRYLGPHDFDGGVE